MDLTAVRLGVSTRVDCYYLVAYGYSVSSGYPDDPGGISTNE